MGVIAGDTVITPDGVGVVAAVHDGRCDWAGCARERCIEVRVERWPNQSRSYEAATVVS